MVLYKIAPFKKLNAHAMNISTNHSLFSILFLFSLTTVQLVAQPASRLPWNLASTVIGPTSVQSSWEGPSNASAGWLPIWTMHITSPSSA